MSVSDVEQFLAHVRGLSDEDVRDVHELAERTFPVGAEMEHTLTTLRALFPRQGPVAMVLVRAQLERDGLSPDELHALTLFHAPLHGRDVVLVLRPPGPKVVGVYPGLYGR